MKGKDSIWKGIAAIIVVIGIWAYISSEIDHKKDIEWRTEVHKQMRQSYGPPINDPYIWCTQCLGNKLCSFCNGGWFDRHHKYKCTKCCNGICCKCGGTGLR